MLILRGNWITVIPDSFARLTNLRHLWLNNNRLIALPDSFARLDNLIYLNLKGNPGLRIPDEILELRHGGGAQKILTYYFAQRSGARPLNEGELILVGRGGVGKTSLVNTLTTGKFERSEKTTEGIKINDWSCALTRQDKVTVHIWDFGGQEMMHATHQFFLTARSLYLLVMNRRQDDCNEEFEYWLRLIRAFGGKDASVIVVLNKQGEEPFDVNRAGWKEKYPDNIKGFVETDCIDSQSIARLKKSVQQQLKEMSSLKANFPTRWFAIKDKLAKMKTDYVTFDQYRAMCRELGEQDPKLQTSLSGYLNDLGVALNYRDDPRLRFAYVLKPEWVTEGIYALLHAFVDAKGLFSPADAEKVLVSKGYPAETVDFMLGSWKSSSSASHSEMRIS
jgi:internalin A